ncbi:hypothetical protein GW17_00002190 [Ensete ventricosum]|nr:hypothetical protein GW17_00002190 [Ensete ventricosum]
MSRSFPRFSFWIWGKKNHESSTSSLSSSPESPPGSKETDYLKFPPVNEPGTGANSRKNKKKRQSREERRIDKESDIEVVPSDGGRLLGSESDDSNWSIGWLEHLSPEFHGNDESENSFAVLVRCYARGRSEQAESSKSHALGAGRSEVFVKEHLFFVSNLTPSSPLGAMEWSSTLAWLMSLLLLICSGNSEEYAVRLSLVGFLQALSGNDTGIIEKLGWSAATDPCTDGWNGVTCNNRTSSVYKIELEELGLRGTIDAGRLCQAPSLAAVSLLHNAIRGEIPPEISDCGRLTHLYLGGNRLTGGLPPSLTLLGNLKVLDVSDNGFSGKLPDLAKISGLVGFLAQNNRLHGAIPGFRFGNFDRRRFNVSNNLFAGPIPPGGDRLDQTSFIGNPGLCGKPLPVACPPSPSKEDHKSLRLSREKAIMFSGYIALGLVLFLFVTYKSIHRKKKTKHRKIADEKIASDSSSGKSSIPWASTEASTTATSSLIVLKRPGTTTDLKFDDLLKAPAELLGRGRNGSLYKVTMADGTSLAVKRIKDCGTSAAEFRTRMERIDMVRHPNVLPPVAFHCSTQEKLVVYECQRNGSLSSLLQGKATT